MAQMSDKTKATLEAILAAPGKTAIDYATEQGVSVGQVTGAINSLKKAGMIVVGEGGVITATEDATFEYGDGDTTKKASTELDTTAGTDTMLDAEDGEGIGGAITAEGTGIATEASATEAPTAEAPAATKVAPSAFANMVAQAMSPTATAPAAGKTATSTTPAGPAVVSKAAKARAVWEANKDAPRKVLMQMMMAPEIGLTSHGANTYIHNFKKAAGLVTPRGTAVATPAAPVAEEPAFAPEVAETVAVTENVVVDITAEAAPETAPEAATEVAAEQTTA